MAMVSERDLQVRSICGEKTVDLPAAEPLEHAFAFARAHGVRRFNVDARLGGLDFVRRYRDEIDGIVISGPSADVEALDLGPLFEHEGLRELAISREKDPPDLSRFPSLARYSGTYHSGLNLALAPRIESVSLENYGREDLGPFPWPRAVSAVELIFPHIRTLTGAESAPPSLRRLSIRRARRLVSGSIGGELQLQQLWLENCSKAVFRKGMKCLRSLRVNHVAPLADLMFLREMPLLEDFRFVGTKVLDGNLEPIVSHPSLKWVGMLDRRGLSHSQKQVDAVLRARGGYAEWRVDDGFDPAWPYR